ncbi:MAG: sulfotransferase, partial [Planctomycetota bacterium]
ECVNHALRLSPDDHRVLFWAGVARQQTGDVPGALDVLRKARQLAPASQELDATLARTLWFADELEEAYDLVRSAAEAPAPFTTRWIFGEVASRLGHDREAERVLRDASDDRDLTAEERRSARFALSGLHDRAKRFDEAVREATRAHALDAFDFDPDVCDESMRRTREVFTAERMGALPRSGIKSSRALFIVGLPRSGTTLLEQIVGRHSAVTAGGEQPHIAATAHVFAGNRLSPSRPTIVTDEHMTAGTLYREGKAYAERMGRLDRRSRYITDKAPLNGKHLGLIDRMLPDARIICIRRDPRDNAISYHMKHMPGMHPQAGSFTALARFMNAYDALLRHWRDVLTIPMLDVRYEQLVRETEGEVRRILGFLDLPFEDACLRPHESERIVITSSFEQVRQPISSGSIGRWQRYAPHLQPLIDTLDDALLDPYRGDEA